MARKTHQADLIGNHIGDAEVQGTAAYYVGIVHALEFALKELPKTGQSRISIQVQLDDCIRERDALINRAKADGVYVNEDFARNGQLV